MAGRACCCSHNQEYFDEAKAKGLIRGGALPAILAAAGGVALSFAAKVVVMSILTNAVKFFIGLANVHGTDLPKEKKNRVLKQYVKHLMSRQSLLTGPMQQVLMGEVLRQVPAIASKLESGAVSAKDAVSSAATTASDALALQGLPVV